MSHATSLKGSDSPGLRPKSCFYSRRIWEAGGGNSTSATVAPQPRAEQAILTPSAKDLLPKSPEEED